MSHRELVVTVTFFSVLAAMASFWMGAILYIAMSTPACPPACPNDPAACPAACQADCPACKAARRPAEEAR
jgi:hypothetical protein